MGTFAHIVWMDSRMDITSPQPEIAASIPNTRARTGRRTLVVLAGLAALTVALWLPFGWNVAPLLDSWSLLLWVDSGARPFFVPDVAPTRPLTYIPWIVSLLLTPDSFVGHNLLFAAILVGTGAAMYAVMRRVLPGQPIAAWLAAALIIVFPADHGLFYLDAINIRAALLLLLAAVYALLEYWRRPALWRLLGMLAIQAWGVLMYEAGIPLLLLAPLLLLWLDGRLSRRWVALTAVWSIIPLAWFLYFIATLLTGEAAYQRSLFSSEGAAANLIGGLLFMVRQNLWTGFALGAQHLIDTLTGTLSPLFLGVAALVGGGVGALGLWLHRREPGSPLPPRRAVLLILGGLLAMLAGFVVYIPTQDFANMHYIWRLFYFTSIGGVMVLLGLLLLLPWRTVFIGAAALLVGLAALRGLEQHSGHVERGEDQKRLAASVVAQAPAVADGTLLLVLDESTEGEMRAFILNYGFEHALSFTYGHRRTFGRICFGARRRPEEFCRFEDGQVVVPGIWGGEEAFLIEQVVAFQYDEHHGMALADTIPERYLAGADASAYHPRALIDADAPLPPRLFTLLDYRRE
jgi:hypothetical protein